MTSNPPTIIDLKASFLRTQILALSRPVTLSSTLPLPSAEETTLRQKAIDDALYKLNALIKKHNRLAYGPQAQRHVAEQIDRLYWNAGERGILGGIGEDERWAERGTDYRDSEVIEKLPEVWSEDAEEQAPEQAERFKVLQARLKEANEKRRVAREKVERYRQMKGMIDMFGSEAGVQANLITRNGEVESELEKMRRLMVRVVRGIEGLEEREEGVGECMDLDTEEGEDRKVLALLGS